MVRKEKQTTTQDPIRVRCLVSRYLSVTCGLRIAALSLILIALSSCGYRLANTSLGGGTGRTISVPTFTNRTTTYRSEQRMTEAVRQELIRRTGFKVIQEPGGDLAMTGEVLSYGAVPVIFNQQGRGSAYTMVVDMTVR